MSGPGEPARVHTFGQWLLARYGQRVHKVTINAAFTCPNRDGTRGVGGCTFCNNTSFNPSTGVTTSVEAQLACGQAVTRKRTGARLSMAYFQAYTNTYAPLDRLRDLYERALSVEGVVGLSVGTRPDCVPDGVLDLLAGYRSRGKEVWLELGLQSSFDETLVRINRGHDFATYRDAVKRAHARGLPICTHLILGLPGETAEHGKTTLARVLEEGVEGLKLHPLHVVRDTALADELACGAYRPWSLAEYVEAAADLVERTPWGVVFHRLTGTASRDILLAPDWCAKKWLVLNAIEEELGRRGVRQGQHAAAPERRAILEQGRAWWRASTASTG